MSGNISEETKSAAKRSPAPEVLPRSFGVPRETWSDKEAFDVAARKLVQMFQDNCAKFESVVQADVMAVAMSA
jgi:ATP-dependent phosphoenolpyruvate carboxykinase